MSFDKKRLCSHLVDYARRALPATLLHDRNRGRVRTFLSIHEELSDHKRAHIITQNTHFHSVTRQVGLVDRL